LTDYPNILKIRTEITGPKGEKDDKVCTVWNCVQR